MATSYRLFRASWFGAGELSSVFWLESGAGGAMGLGVTMSAIEYLRIYTDVDECSHFEERRVGLGVHDYAPPAWPLNVSEAKSAEKFLFLELPAGWFGDWHPTPVRQWFVFMSGVCEFEVEDGQRCLRKAGDVLLLEDLSGKGHLVKVIGGAPVRIAAIHLS
jgi:hypothetical protein